MRVQDQLLKQALPIQVEAALEKFTAAIPELNVADQANMIRMVGSESGIRREQSEGLYPGHAFMRANTAPGGNQFLGTTKAATVADRANCARLCKMQGRTSCRYCHGEGFAQKSEREKNPSRNVNKARELQYGKINE